MIIDISEKIENFINLIKFHNCFSLSVGGGVESISDADKYFKSGVDKIVLGTGSINNPNIAKTISQNMAINQLYTH